VRAVWLRAELDFRLYLELLYPGSACLILAEPKSVDLIVVSRDIEKCVLLVVSNLSNAKAFLEPFS